jgi:hypothetical protein
MNRNIKYKQVVRLGLFGDDDLNVKSNCQYNVYPTSIPGITMVAAGSNYTAAATVITLSNNNNSGFNATPTITSGGITAITKNNGGSGYENNPNVVIFSGISSTTSIVGGSGYTNGTFNLGISGNGSGGAGTFTISGGALTSIDITSPGIYHSAPTLSFPGAGAGTGASATAVIGSGALANITGIFTNAKRMRFGLNNALNDLKLSQNARCIVETCNIPSFQNMAGRYALIRLVVSSQDKTCDKKYLNGNPILISMATQPTLGSTNVLYNASEFFYNVNVPTNFFSNGFVDIELEIPSASANIDFLTNKPLSTFFLNLIIVDEDPELTKDINLSPPIDYKNYNVNLPIKQY